MALFLDGSPDSRPVKRKSRECLICAETILDEPTCPKHVGASSYCGACIARTWIENGRVHPTCQVCCRPVSFGTTREALVRYDARRNTTYASQFDKHQVFLNGDVELPTEGYNKKTCVCHDPPCKGTVTPNGLWVTFKAALVVPQVHWDETRYKASGKKCKAHLPICACCLAPASSRSADLTQPCAHCGVGAQRVAFLPLYHYIDPLAGAKGQWGMPRRVHQVSRHDLIRHLYWILEDPNLFVRCPVDGTILEHGNECHELMCPTCKLTRICYVCGRAEVTGPDGVLVDHYGGNPCDRCLRYPSMYKWSQITKGGDTPTALSYPCTDACVGLASRCQHADHRLWYTYFMSWRRMSWLVAYLREAARPHYFLIAIAKRHPAVARSVFAQYFVANFGSL